MPFNGKARFLNQGFTLIEIMIVVAIIGLLVAVALPNFLRMRVNANEKLIRADLHVFSTANETYRAMQNPPLYAPDIQALIAQNYLDNTWLNPGNKHGYNFIYTLAPTGISYSLEADVLSANVTGVNYYCVDQTGVMVMAAAPGLGTVNGCIGGTPIDG